MNRPRVIIAGTQSGVGKTSISLGLMTGLKASGHRVQAFKVGPDYIDPSYHAAATGSPSYNLDSWLLEKETLTWLFQTKSEMADISIIEGVMGLYDGFGSKEDTGSTAQIAKILNAPVILVLDARSIARSIAAMVKGYVTFDPEIQISGIILNRVGSPRHLDLLKESIEHYTGIPVLGAFFKNMKIQIPERHLGLTTATENNELQTCLEALTDLSSGLDLEKILQIAKEAAPLPAYGKPESLKVSPGKPVLIGIAWDRAFSFYYQANLDLLKELNATLIPFSPLNDEKLPENLSALYFGGGFPEIFASELEDNVALKLQVKQLIQSDLPVYAECGGLMYLSESIKTLNGKSYTMVGAIPGKISMTEKLQNFGYKEGKMMDNTILGSKGNPVRGHEFHYSKREDLDEGKVPYELTDRKSGQKQLEGYVQDSLLASYLHLHFLSNPNWAIGFVKTARDYNQRRKEVAIR